MAAWPIAKLQALTRGAGAPGQTPVGRTNLDVLAPPLLNGRTQTGYDPPAAAASVGAQAVNDHSTRDRWLALLAGGPRGLWEEMETQRAAPQVAGPGAPLSPDHHIRDRWIALIAGGPRGLWREMQAKEAGKGLAAEPVRSARSVLDDPAEPDFVEDAADDPLPIHYLSWTEDSGLQRLQGVPFRPGTRPPQR